MQITIAGGGNIGMQFAVHCAQEGHCVTLLTSRPEQFSKVLSCVDADGNVTACGTIAGATADPETACCSADVIFVTVPADCMASYAQMLLPHIRPGTRIGLIPGTGGGECAFRPCLEKGAVLFGLQRVPAVARAVEPGKTVCSTGYRGLLHAAALPKSETESCCRLLESIFHIPCASLPDYLNLTLTPSNPILHTTRLRTLFRDYSAGVVYERIPLFYQEWTDESSRLLLACDAEVQQLCRQLKAFDLSGVKSLKEHYESDTAEKMTYKISHIPAFQGLTSPHKATEGGFVPDLDSRYFTADFSYGLTILVQIARMAKVSAPHMEETLHWYQTVAGDPPMFDFSRYGIRTMEDLIVFYRQ